MQQGPRFRARAKDGIPVGGRGREAQCEAQALQMVNTSVF